MFGAHNAVLPPYYIVLSIHQFFRVQSRVGCGRGRGELSLSILWLPPRTFSRSWNICKTYSSRHDTVQWETFEGENFCEFWGFAAIRESVFLQKKSYFPPIRKSFLPQKFSAIQYYLSDCIKINLAGPKISKLRGMPPDLPRQRFIQLPPQNQNRTLQTFLWHKVALDISITFKQLINQTLPTSIPDTKQSRRYITFFWYEAYSNVH